MAAFHEHVDQEKTDHGEDEDHVEACELGDSGKTGGTVCELEAQNGVDVSKNDSDDFTESQCDDCKALSLQREYRNRK